MGNLWSTAKGLARSSAVREHAKNTLGHLKDVFNVGGRVNGFAAETP